MIAKHIHCQPEHDQYGRLARYIADAGHDGEKCLASWCAGCSTEDNYDLAALEITATQALNTRSIKEKTYHLMVSFRQEDEARLSPKAFKAIEERFATALGFSEHQRHCGVHKNTNNIHLHMAYNMVHPEKLTGQESFESYAKRHKENILGALNRAPEWQGFHEALKAHGLEIKPHGNGLIVKNAHGEHAAKASAVDRALSAKRLQERFGDFQPYRGVRQIQELSRYQAAPLHRSPEPGELYAKYKTGIETRKKRLGALKEQENEQLATIRQQWEAKRREIEKMDLPKRNRSNLLTLARKHENEAIAKAKLEFQPEREAVRRDVPFTSWSGFLRHEAENGNAVALAVLRSGKETMEPEQAPEIAAGPAKAPAKDWSRHGLDYTAQAVIRADYAAKPASHAEYAEKERELQERGDLSTKGKRQLQAFLRMERTAAEARAEGTNLGDIKRRVDGKGVVIFTLESGGSMRDAGRELFFSASDKAAEAAALLYARAKWGRHVAMDGNHISRTARNIEQSSPDLPTKNINRGMER